MSVVVLGVGNLLMCDEGVGVHTIAALERGWDFPPEVRLVDGGTSTQELLGDLEGLDHLLVIDAITSGAAPGSIVRLDGDAVPAVFTTKLSPHQIGISDLLATLTFLGRAPKRVDVFGVEPMTLTLDMELSPEIAAKVPELCALVLAELARLGSPATALGGAP